MIIMNKFYMLIGLPGSGKSTYALGLKDAVIHSSDSIREELYNNINDQEHNNEVFAELHRRIKADLKAGKDVVYDACNVSRKYRKAFINEIKNIECEKIAILIVKNIEECIRNDIVRARTVGADVIWKFVKRFDPPTLQEGFDEIKLVKITDKFFTPTDILLDYYDMNQNNKHHTLSLGEHSKKVSDNFKNYIDSFIGWFHDLGKPFTKTTDLKTGESHYYGHEHVGSYLVLSMSGFSEDELLYMSTIINLHMAPFNWTTNEQKEKFKKFWGEKIYDMVCRLHEADIAAK